MKEVEYCRTLKKEGRTAEDGNKLKSLTDKAKKEYLQSICDEIMEFQRTGCSDFMCMKSWEVVWKENVGFETMASKNLEGI
jgi:hypothetical protein